MYFGGNILMMGNSNGKSKSHKIKMESLYGVPAASRYIGKAVSMDKKHVRLGIFF